MAGSSSGGDANYWPGFVDALTNVVIAMVFVIVVLAMALSFSAQLLARRMSEKVADLQRTNAALTQQVQASTAAAQQELPKESNRIESLVPQLQRIIVRGEEAAASASGGALRVVNASLMVEYEGSALQPDPQALRQLLDALGPLKDRLNAASAGTQVLLVARGPNLAFSDNQRTAYLRVLAIRNVLMENGIPPERVVTRVDPSSKTPKPSVSVALLPPP